MRTTAELREGFLRFFESKDHTRLPSAPLIPPPEDTSTLVVSAGMQPLMPYFLGQKAPPAPLVTCLSCSPTSVAVSGDSSLVRLAIWSWTVAGSATSP